MKKNEVNIESIRKLSSDNLGVSTNVISVFLIALLFIGINVFEIKTDEGRQSFAGFIIAAIFSLKISSYFLSRYSKFFLRKACIYWKENDMRRINFFNIKIKALNKGIKHTIAEQIEEYLKRAPEDREYIKKHMIDLSEILLANIRKTKDLLDRELSKEDPELIALLREKNELDAIEDVAIENLLDFIIVLDNEAKDENLVRIRIEKMLRENLTTAYREYFEFYKSQLESCKKSTAELSRFLNEELA